MIDKRDFQTATTVYNCLLEGRIGNVSPEELETARDVFGLLGSFLLKLHPDFYIAALEANDIHCGLMKCGKKNSAKGLLTSCTQ